MVLVRFIALFVLTLSVGVLIASAVKKETGGERAALLTMSGIEKADPLPWKFDKIRELVNAYSAYHGADGNGPAGGVSGATLALYHYAAGARQTPPELSSAARADVFARLLRIAGFKARTVTLLRPSPPYFAHTLVEVYNRRTRQWELQDQDYNIFYTFKGSIQRVSLADMLSQPLDNFIPCHQEGDCNWMMAAPDGLNAENLRPFFAAALVQGRDRKFLAINKSRFDLQASGLCEKEPPLCSVKKIYYK